MLEFLSSNLATIIIAAAVAAVMVLAFLKLRRDKKKGRSCCGSCAGCNLCHSGDREKDK